jgi:hypothetical protein
MTIGVADSTSEKDAEAIQKSARERDDARPFPIQPQPAEETRDSENKNRNCERKGYFLDRPVKLSRQGNPENTPCVNRTKSHLHQEARYCEPPAICIRHKLLHTNL